MTANTKRRLYLTLMTAILCVCLAGGQVLAQDATGTGSKDRVAKRYAGTTTKGAAAGSAETGAEGKIQKIPLPDFVKEGSGAQGTDLPTLHPTKDGQAYDMGTSVQRSLDANPQMQSARSSASGAEESRRQALANFGPVGTVSYGYTRTEGQAISSMAPHPQNPYWLNTYELKLAVTQPLFTGFKLLSNYQKASLAKDQAEANIKYSELTLVKSVQKAFLALLQARSNVQSNKDSVARLESQFKVAQAYYDVGLKPRLDVLQAESDLATAEQNLLKAQNNVLVQTAQLNSLLNLPLDQDTNFVGELTYLPFTMNVADCLDTAYKQRPDLYMGVKSVQIAERDVKIAASTFYPQVQAQASVARDGNTPSLDVRNFSGATTPETRMFGVTATLQAWDWGSTYFGVQSARETVKKLQADLAKMRLDVGYEVKTYYLNIQDAARRIAVARTALEASKEGFRMAQARYQAQVGTNTDVLTSQAQVSSAEFNLTQALTDYQSALADIYAGMGIKNTTLMPN